MYLSLTYILISVSGAAVGQLLLKRGMSLMGPITLEWSGLITVLLGVATNPFVIAGLIVYGVSTVFWLTALSRVELSLAYPFVSLGYIIMLLGAWQLFDEDLNAARLIGTAVVVVGLILISRS